MSAGSGFGPRSLPGEAVDEVLALSGRRREDVTTYVVAEQEVQLPRPCPRHR